MKRLVILGVLAVLATTGSAVPISGCKTTHQVSLGESCYSIANGRKLTVAQLQSINPSLDCNKLQPRELVCVQGTLPPPKSFTCTTQHKVKLGESCYNIATIWGLSVPQLQAINPSLNCTPLEVGIKICVKVVWQTSISAPVSSSTLSTSTKTSTSPTSTPTNIGCTKLVIVKSQDTCEFLYR